MASLSRQGLLDEFERAALASGYMAVRTSDAAKVPARYLLTGASAESIALLVYIKNFTPADRANVDEYRIQLRRDVLPLQMKRYATTVLLGYHQKSGLFVGFDPSSVSTTARTQISVGYVGLRAVKRAVRRGMSFDRDRLGRIAVGIRPELLVPYCLHARELHGAADEASITALLNEATAAFNETEPGADLTTSIDVPSERKRLLRSVSVLSRDAGFRCRVLEAYGYKCAVSQMQLGLVDAAHVLPVCEDGSHDRVSNGVSLLPQFHRAFDSGLIYLTPKYKMRLNEARVTQLDRRGLSGGLDDLRDALGSIELPAFKREWPDPALIAQANRARGIRV